MKSVIYLVGVLPFCLESGIPLKLSESSLAVGLPPHSMKEVSFKVQPVGKPREGIYRIRIHGQAEAMNFGKMS